MLLSPDSPHGVGTDDPLVWYEGSGTTDRRWLHHDAQGSVIAWSNASGGVAATQLYQYGAYGEPSSNGSANWNGSRFRYTGQITIPEANLYYYKARVYDPIRGWFLQTDPVGFKADLDLYAYVGEDPLDRNDPDGLEDIPVRYVDDSVGNLKVSAYPGKKATDTRAEHGPDHVHIKDGKVDVRISTDTWKPLQKVDEKLITRKIEKFLKAMKPETKEFIRAAQKDIFETGKIGVEANILGVKAASSSTTKSREEEGKIEARQERMMSKLPPEVRALIKSIMKSGKSEED